MQNGTEKKRKGLAAAIAALVMVVILGLVLLSLLTALEETAVFGISVSIWPRLSWWSMPW